MAQIREFIATNALAFISLIISLLSVAFTFSQSRTAKKSLKIQEEMYNDGQSNINLELLDNFIFDDKNSEKVYFFFRVVINNLSDNATSIYTYSLSLICSDLTYKLKYTDKSIEPYSDFSCLDIAQNIDAHNSVCGWCIFELPRNNYCQIDIDLYELEIRDIHNNFVKKESILLREELAIYEEEISKS